MESLIYSKNHNKRGGYSSDFDGNHMENHMNGNVDRLHDENPAWIESKTVSCVVLWYYTNSKKSFTTLNVVKLFT